MDINNYNPSHRGTQPVRVLEHNLPHALEQANAGFLALTQQLVDQGIFYPGITYFVDEAALNDLDQNGQPHKPYLKDGRVIHIHESFLSYLWCISYALITLYEEQVAKPDQNRLAGAVVYPINSARVQAATALFEYARSLVVFFDAWPNGLPNPETYTQAEAAWIEGINGVYVAAASFILLHEFNHSLRQHSAQKRALRVSGATDAEYNELSRRFEQEADAFALSSMQQGYRLVNVNGRQMSTKVTSDVGSLVGLCALIFMAPSVAVSSTHPSLAERIDTLIQTIQPDPESQLWGIACVALKLWASQFGHQLSFPAELDSYEQLYHLMLEQAQQIK